MNEIYCNWFEIFLCFKIVGIQGIGKHALAKAIVESSTSKTLQW